MIVEGCQGKPRTPTIIEKICPNCGHEIEMFSIDTQMACEHCGFVAYNDTWKLPVPLETSPQVLPMPRIR